ncbi:hypothetical protein L9F63_006889, partial [Diploptera punctata]
DVNLLSNGITMSAGGDLGATAAAFYKLSDSSSSSAASASEPEDCPSEVHEPSPPNKKQRLLCPTQQSQESEYHLVPPPSSSPTLDIMMKAGGINNHHNNNNSMTHNNNNSTSSSHPMKRTMDDVLKRLTSKMHISNAREEKRPTPASTPTGKSTSVGEHQPDVSPPHHGDAVVTSAVMDGAAVLHQALAGESFLEKERRLSEMIRQLQMVREQLLTQQEQQSKATLVSICHYIKLYFKNAIMHQTRFFFEKKILTHLCFYQRH